MYLLYMDTCIFIPLPTKQFYMLFWSSVDFLSSKNQPFENFRNTIRMSNSLDPAQARQVGPDLGPNCLPRLSDDTNR